MNLVIQEVKAVLDNARNNVAHQVNSELLNTYWNIGRIICEYEQSEPGRADYGKQTLKELSKVLTQEFGKGFSRSNLQNMRAFYLTYEKCQTLSGKLSWSHYYVDMVFYNKILRAYVLIELKTTKLTPEAAGQINMYLNYYAAEVNDPDDNPPIGIILCTEKDRITAEYALGGLSNNIFASRYVLYMPNKEQLIAQVEAVLKRWHEEDKERLDEE